MSQQAWEQFYEKRNRFYINIQPIFEGCLRNLRAHKIHTVLDIGCGSGRYSIALAHEGYKVKGIDFSQEAIKLARKWADLEHVKITFTVGDIHKNLPYPSNSFDAAIAIDSIHYDTITSISFTLSEISRVLREGGILFVTLPQKTANKLMTHLIFTKEEANNLIEEYFTITGSSCNNEEFICIWAINNKKAS
jgi:ubiquinone/menaquinone biosynthesis C-methylase UbiE